jgi:hypothetical protein
MNRALRIAVRIAFTLSAAALVAGPAVHTISASALSVAADPSITQLRDLGKRLADAVLKHDVETILTHDMPGNRADSRLQLQDPNSDLYCFLFDSACNSGRPSVSDILSGAARLEIDVQLLPENGQPTHGWLVFFDGNKIDKSRLRSPEFLCQHTGEIASWMFRWVNDEWVSTHPPFDNETDTICSPR